MDLPQRSSSRHKGDALNDYSIAISLPPEIEAEKQVYSRYRSDMRKVINEDSDEIDRLRAELAELKGKK